MRLWRYSLATTFLLLSIAEFALAQYPSKPIRIVVPFTAGGFNDTLARTLGHKLHERWGKPVVVENRPGGSTVIGTDLVAKAAPDGHTLLIVSFAFAVNPSLQPRLPYDTLHDFAPVILAAGTPNLLVVHPSLPVRSVQELIALARSKPGTLDYASAGNGTSNHLSMELFKSMAQVDLVHVPYKGSAHAMVELVGGQVDVMFDNLPNVMQHVKAGKLRALAVSSAQRNQLVAALPTVAEAGVASFDVEVWFGVVAPKATPQAVIAKLNAEIDRILQLPDVKQKFASLGVDILGGTPQRLDAHLRTQMGKWAGVVKRADIGLD